MESISRKLKVEIPKEQAFRKFIEELNEWWPKEYTWSQEKLKEIKIERKSGGLCSEIGPYGFRCDWGRVTELKENEHIGLKWQISPAREPIPDPEKASDITIQFTDASVEETIVVFEHFNFENHGSGAKDYQEMMNGEQGWDYILSKYRKYCLV